jgi:hypothetical protein
MCTGVVVMDCDRMVMERRVIVLLMRHGVVLQRCANYS